MASEAAGTHGRMHALDGLRGTMMLLGLVLHSACSYLTVGLGEVWPYQDSARTVFADIAVSFIHVFRMPIFFALAGFFAAMLYLRRGVGGFLSNRFQRIGIPLVVGLTVLAPVIKTGFAFAAAARGANISEAWAVVAAMAAELETYIPRVTSHLWFLYDLLYFYGVAALVAAACIRAPASWRAAVLDYFGRLVRRPFLRVAIPAVVTALTLVPLNGVVPTVTAFTPNPLALLAYGIFFGFGWLLYFHRDTLPSFDRLAWVQAIGGVILFLIVKLGVMPVLIGNRSLTAAVYAWSIMSGVVTWMMFFGVTGLFLRHLDRPSARIRYIVDGSYWVYLVHLPFMTWVLGLMAGLDVSVWLKWTTVLVSAAAFGFVTYDLLVRSSFIGQVLNGHRYPRGFPAITHLEATPSTAS